MNVKADVPSTGSGTAVDLARLESYLAAAPRVVAATVFGSARDGGVQPGSDLEYEDVMATVADQQRHSGQPGQGAGAGNRSAGSARSATG